MKFLQKIFILILIVAGSCAAPAPPFELEGNWQLERKLIFNVDTIFVQKNGVPSTDVARLDTMIIFDKKDFEELWVFKEKEVVVENKNQAGQLEKVAFALERKDKNISLANSSINLYYQMKVVDWNVLELHSVNSIFRFGKRIED